MGGITSVILKVLGFFFSVSLALSVPCFGLNPDGTLLLSFKYSVLADPLSVLENWNYDDDSPCSWTGVTCAGIGPFPGDPDVFRVIRLSFPSSRLLGSIPEELGLIQHLRSLDLSNNSFNGTLPASLFNSSELRFLSLSSNLISGELPQFGSLPISLQVLNLSDNALSGTITKSITSLKSLAVVVLRSNYFFGEIPSGFDFVQVLDLSSNLFNGSLPSEFGGEKLNYLNLSNNGFSGSITPEFAKTIPPNATIDLSFNNLTGQIPQLPTLSSQKTESFAGNFDLCGKPLKRICTIPSTLSTPPNVSTNGTSPAAIAVIPKTIGSSPPPNAPGTPVEAKDQTQRGPRLKPGKLVAIVVGDLAGIGLLVVIFLYANQLKKNKKKTQAVSLAEKQSRGYSEETITTKETSDPPSACSCLTLANGDETSETATGSDSDENGPKNGTGHAGRERESEEPKKQRALVMVDGETELEIETLLKASAYVLGSSGSSIVYKAVIEGRAAFAVRRIGESGVGRVKEFENQVRAIATLRHPNLVRVRGFYWGEEEKLLICDYVSNGSLAGACSQKSGSSVCPLSFHTRLKIAKGVAHGLAYIHEKKHVHGNVKPSNILLTPDMDPVIGDFGLDWLVSGPKSYKMDGSTRHFGSKRSAPSPERARYSSGQAGGCTCPYHAPESLKTLKPSPKWDVYSFGAVLLELITGRTFPEGEFGQWGHGWGPEARARARAAGMADVAIRDKMGGQLDAVLACFKLGISCVSLVPQRRPPMKDVVQALEKISFPASL